MDMTITGDNPICNKEDDKLGRAEVVKSFVEHVLRLDVSHGAVVGVFGPWGSGKTSFLNLAQEEFSKSNISMFEFNPWVFSSAEQLVEMFFKELSSEIGAESRLEKVGDAFGKYGNVLSATTRTVLSFAGTPLAGEIATAFLDVATGNSSQPTNLRTLRKNVEDAIKNCTSRIIVILDDVDRLAVGEIREVFKLVRLTASFENLIYIVSCDRSRVENALDENGFSGREYLEKIVQFPYDLPSVPRQQLRQLLEGEIYATLAIIGSTVDYVTWLDAYEEIILPLIGNVRDVRRYVNSVRETLVNLQDRVEPVDVLALEAVRIFLPDVFKKLPSVIEILTNESWSNPTQKHLGISPRELQENFKLRILQLVNLDESHSEIVSFFIYKIFPAASPHLPQFISQHMRKETDDILSTRVSSEPIFRLYLERMESVDLLNFHDAQRAFNYMTRSEYFYEYLLGLPSNRRLYVIKGLNKFNVRFRPDHLEPVITGLLKFLPELTNERRVYFADAAKVVNAVIQSLLKAFRTSSPNEEQEWKSGRTVRRILDKIGSYSSKVELIQQVGDQNQTGNQLLDPEVLAGFKHEVCEHIASIPVDQLIEERNLAELLYFAKKLNLSIEQRITETITTNSEITFAVLSSARMRRYHSIRHDESADRNPVLNMTHLIEIYGNKATLKERIDDLEGNIDSVMPMLKILGVERAEVEQLIALARQMILLHNPDNQGY